MKLSDYVVSYLENKGVSHVFGVTGGGAMHLNDSLGKSKRINFIMVLMKNYLLMTVLIVFLVYQRYMLI